MSIRFTSVRSLNIVFAVSLLVHVPMARAAEGCASLFGQFEVESLSLSQSPTLRQKVEDAFSFRIRQPEFPSDRFEEVTPGRVFRGPLPWNDSAMAFLRDKGVRKIISLIMHEGDIALEKAAADLYGIEVEFVRVPNFNHAHPTGARARSL